jgi:ABC-type multidrug transport system ATPase subunit
VELIEEMTLKEFLHFHFHLNPFPGHISIESFLELVYLEGESGKYVKNFSTGMKQRLKLALGMFSSNPVLLMDEPTSNLDPMGKAWFREHFGRVKGKKLILMASNQPDEIELCPYQVQIENYQ